MKKRRMSKKRALISALVLLLSGVLLFAGTLTVLAAEEAPVMEGGLTDGAEEIDDSLLGSILGNRTSSVEIIVLLTILSLLPSILLMMTGFTRMIIVLSFLRNAMGTQSMPPNQVIVGLALFLTFFIMSPVISQIGEEAYEPYVNNEITQEEALERAQIPIRRFMLRQTYATDLQFFMRMSQRDDLPDIARIQAGEEEAINSMPIVVVTPAFITSEIKRAFQIGFFIYIPFVVIDMVVASTLMSMGMMMLPPSLISLPFKVLLFVVVDGWQLTVQTLITSFGQGGG